MSTLPDIAIRVKALMDERAAVSRRYASVNGAAKLVGISQRTLARIVGGETPCPRLQVLDKLARHFFVDTGWLITGRGPRTRQGLMQEKHPLARKLFAVPLLGKDNHSPGD